MRKTVLIVDDNTFIRHALYELFRREADFEVCGVAENGREAIEQAGRLHPDLVVLDLSMPVMNGLDAARVLRRMMPSVPLIMYSAFEDRSSEQRARLIGISELVSKSERVSVLIDKARRLLYPKAALSFFASGRQEPVTSEARSTLPLRRRHNGRPSHRRTTG